MEKESPEQDHWFMSSSCCYLSLLIWYMSWSCYHLTLKKKKELCPFVFLPQQFSIVLASNSYWELNSWFYCANSSLGLVNYSMILFWLSYPCEQVKCFNAPLQQSEIVGVKRVVQEKLPQGVSERGLTLTGFLFLHALFIEKGRLETTWTVLRKFGYDNDIKLSEDLIPYSSFKRSPDQVLSYCHNWRIYEIL